MKNSVTGSRHKVTETGHKVTGFCHLVSPCGQLVPPMVTSSNNRAIAATSLTCCHLGHLEEKNRSIQENGVFYAVVAFGFIGALTTWRTR